MWKFHLTVFAFSKVADVTHPPPAVQVTHEFSGSLLYWVTRLSQYFSFQQVYTPFLGTSHSLSFLSASSATIGSRLWCLRCPRYFERLRFLSLSQETKKFKQKLLKMTSWSLLFGLLRQTADPEMLETPETSETPEIIFYCCWWSGRQP